MNNITKNILRKMCEFTDYEYEDINWKDGTHLNISYNTPTGEEEMIDWLTDYLYGLKISELKYISEYPYILYKRKKECRKFSNNFIPFYGFSSYENNIKVKRSKKINKIIKNI